MMRKPAPLRLDSTYNGEEEEEKRNGMAPRADNEQQPDEDDGGKGERQDGHRQMKTPSRLQSQVQARLIVVTPPSSPFIVR